MRKTLLLIILLCQVLFSFSQSEKSVNDPSYKTKLQGVWAKTPPGGPWIKVVIKDDRYYYYSASPSSGEWIDMSSHHRNNRLTSFLKVSKRSDYDGKLFSYNIAYTEDDENGVYTAIMCENNQYISLITKGDNPRYSSSSGKDLNAAIVVDDLKKRPSNFNPWQ